jgi:hypothetical protein
MDIPTYIGRGGLRSAPNEFGKFLISDVYMRYGRILLISA